MHFTISTTTITAPEKGWLIRVTQGSKKDRELLKMSDLNFYYDGCTTKVVYGKNQPWQAMCDVADFVENELGDECTFEIE